ncbi:ubiquitin carboxyl-terminal hydrolase 4 [Coccidioides immitis RMSCC 3703]|uniref:Ubiquitin carboxyl-terminal hydrolase 4 n=1 Tax=Coccidioides immitis RMSCC 3703 TaxID=454286 RepID=A0A0J8TKR4_COCIT|nr:ubiquitin carboxyl-terminal hydrolase 4 [Coccidioides immitis RMSCC 3703]
MRGAVADNNVAGPHFGDQAGIGPDVTHRQYLDMKSLQDMAASLNLNGDVPLNELVRISEDAIQKSKILAQQGQLDLALVQYLRASDVVINVIPNHPDFSYMNRHHPRWAGQFSGLMMAVNSQHATMENIKRKLSSQHNPSYGHESSQSRPNSGGYNASPILPSESSRYEAAQDPRDIPIRMPSPSSFQCSPTIPAILQMPGSPSRKIKPEVKPKPENLMGKPTEEKTTMRDPLTQRFAELRNSHIKRTPIDYSGTTLNNGTWAPPSADSHTSQPLSHSRPRSALDPPPPRPLGPREMNSHRTDPPAPPPKVPISSVEPSLPRVPSPAYSPVTTVPSQPPPNPPRTSVDSIRPVSCRQSSSWMGVSNETLTVVDDNPYRSRTPNALYDTLYEFNMYKPLKYGRQPAFLVGGLDAWVDLVGQQSLSTTHTAAIMHSVRARKPVPGKYQPLRRMPTASANSSWEVKKRRLREFKPLNPEEERAWLEKAKTEEIDPSSYGAGDGVITEEPEDLESAEAELSSSFVHSYEDFLRRFPEPGDIRQSMAGLPMTDHQSTQFHEPLIAHPSRPPPAVPRPSYSGVTDGRHIQPSFARQASATKHALYKASSPLDRIKLPRTGLVNFGSICYMNSIIQSLSATTELTKFFFNNHFHTVVQKNWKGSQGVLPGLYANLVRSLWKNDVEVIRPTSFRKFIGRLNSEWAGSQQQDAKEFFDVLVDCLHEDLNVNWQRTPLRPLTTEQEMRRERMPIHQVSGIEWNRYCHREFSYISSLFAGQHASRLRCTTCRRTSTTYEAFYSISVEIPPSGKGDIYQCLRSYCQEEMLSGDEVWKCPHCRTEREATKQIILTRAPQFLVLHFKRFSASHRQQARKIHTPVYFPLSGLDMTPFMIQPPSTPPSQPQPNGNPAQTSAVSQSQTELSPNDLATSSPFIYNAYAVVRHLGSTIHEGHYISLVRDANRDCWRKFDDHRVTDFQPGNPGSSDCLQSEQAYLVFYERAPRN